MEVFQERPKPAVRFQRELLELPFPQRRLGKYSRFLQLLRSRIALGKTLAVEHGQQILEMPFLLGRNRPQPVFHIRHALRACRNQPPHVSVGLGGVRVGKVAPACVQFLRRQRRRSGRGSAEPARQVPDQCGRVVGPRDEEVAFRGESERVNPALKKARKEGVDPKNLHQLAILDRPAL